MSHSRLKAALKKEIRNILKESQELDELARVATTIKIDNLKAAQAYAEANKGKWVSDMVQAVIDAGEKGITQPDLAAAIGKGSQQTINPKVRELLAAGVFTQGEAGIKSTEPKEPKSAPKIKAIPPKSDEDNDEIETDNDEKDNDSDEDEIADDYFKADEDDNGEDEEDLAKKATAHKGVQSNAKQLDDVVKKMKELAAEYKAAKDDKAKQGEITSKLKDLNKEKARLEKIVHKSLGDEDEEDDEA